jgi:SAM-dependent methyltransferase/catechol 2,3-dioxygenase-like lactoylglutathione lyase family enzyme
MSAKVHIHLHVSDLAKSRDFYRTFFGVVPVKDRPGYLKFLPGWAPVNLALSAGRPGSGEGAIDHLGIQVVSPEAVLAQLTRVKAAGLPVREEMGVDCCHANQDKFWVTDPDGVEWEVYHLNYDLEDDAPVAPRMALSLAPASACCGSEAAPGTAMSGPEIRQRVTEKYGQAASRARSGAVADCGGSSGARSPITADLYAVDETAGLPGEALRASLGCGNPVALADLRPGEVVLDLGSGGGIDVLLSARRVGPTGRAYGLDMTDEMLALARENQAKAGVQNVEFLKGEIEQVPLPDASVDVIVSNCVINLSADKPRVFAEAFRVLRPGGHLAISDVVVAGELPEPVRRSAEAWTGCLAGVLEERDYATLLGRAGFQAIEIRPTRLYTAADARRFFEVDGSLATELERQGLSLEDVLAALDGKYRSAFIRAVKPTGPRTA